MDGPVSIRTFLLVWNMHGGLESYSNQNERMRGTTDPNLKLQCDVASARSLFPDVHSCAFWHCHKIDDSDTTSDKDCYYVNIRT
jgi:hypothetical protein